VIIIKKTVKQRILSTKYSAKKITLKEIIYKNFINKKYTKIK